MLLSATTFIVRGPMRALVSGHQSNDLAPSYAAVKAWLHGQDPYSHDVLKEILRSQGRELDAKNDPVVSTSLYPPPTFIVLLPLSVVSWPVARLLFLAVNLVLFGYHLRSLLRLGRLRVSDNAGLLLVGAVCALAPYHTGIALGQLAIPCVTMLVIAIGQIESDSETSGGMALAVATLLKPQIAAPFVAYYLLRRRWRPALVALTLCASASVVAIGWLDLHHIRWLDGWLANTKLEWNGAGIDTRGPVSFHMVDARLVLTALGVYPAELLTLGLGTVTAFILYTWGMKLDRDSGLLVVSAVGVWTLLITYHRFYDAALVSLPMAWAVGASRDRPELRRLAFASALCCAVFFVPGQVMLSRWADWATSPSLSPSGLWNALALKHQAWTLVLLHGLLLTAMRRSFRAGAAPV